MRQIFGQTIGNSLLRGIKFHRRCSNFLLSYATADDEYATADKLLLISWLLIRSMKRQVIFVNSIQSSAFLSFMPRRNPSSNKCPITDSLHISCLVHIQQVFYNTFLGFIRKHKKMRKAAKVANADFQKTNVSFDKKLTKFRNKLPGETIFVENFKKTTYQNLFLLILLIFVKTMNECSFLLIYFILMKIL